ESEMCCCGRRQRVTMAQTGGWPEILWIVRHGESVENTALHGATARGAPTIEMATRDVDAPLTALGERQARALGRWLGGLRPGEQPTVLLTSPYERALRTAEVLRETGRFGPTAPP